MLLLIHHSRWRRNRHPRRRHTRRKIHARRCHARRRTNGRGRNHIRSRPAGSGGRRPLSIHALSIHPVSVACYRCAVSLCHRVLCSTTSLDDERGRFGCAVALRTSLEQNASGRLPLPSWWGWMGGQNDGQTDELSRTSRASQQSIESAVANLPTCRYMYSSSS